MKVAIVDDEKCASDLLSGYLHEFAKEAKIEFEVKVFGNAGDFLADGNAYEIVLMDIEMPDLDGLSAAKILRTRDDKAVLLFITNMSQYAIKGYEVDAIDYVVKPITYPDFVLKIKKAIRYVANNKDLKYTVTTIEGSKSFYISQLYYIEVNLHYLIFHTANGDIKVRGALKDVEKFFTQHNFVRSNYCYMINLKYVEALGGNTVTVAGSELLVSRSRKADLMNKFAKFVGGLS